MLPRHASGWEYSYRHCVEVECVDDTERFPQVTHVGIMIQSIVLCKWHTTAQQFLFLSSNLSKEFFSCKCPIMRRVYLTYRWIKKIMLSDIKECPAWPVDNIITARLDQSQAVSDYSA